MHPPCMKIVLDDCSISYVCHAGAGVAGVATDDLVVMYDFAAIDVCLDLDGGR